MSESIDQIAQEENDKSSSLYVFSPLTQIPSTISSVMNLPTISTSSMSWFKEIVELDRDDNSDLFKRRLRSMNTRTHTRSASHGGVLATSSAGWQSNLGNSSENYSMSSVAATRPSALKKSGHQRAFSQGQVSSVNQVQSTVVGHSRVGSRTDFILPVGHRDEPRPLIGISGIVKTPSFHGHSRQASRCLYASTLNI